MPSPRLPLLLLALAGFACGDRDRETGHTGAPDAPDAPDDTAETGETADPCADVPLVDWNNFGQSFILHNCQGCHASYSVNRYGAPEDVTFDTADEVWAQADRVLDRSTGDSPTMPPQGGVSDDDRVRLEWWLTCAPEGT